MNLTKKEKTALLKVYEIWWRAYLGGDLETYNHYLDEDFRFVGSTDGEEFLDKKATTSFLAATADQLAGKAKLENIDRTIETHDGTVIITDLANAFILNDSEWVYYARFRFTSMMKHTEKGWRFYYQHFSTPDLMANEGETLGIDKVTAENIELKNAIKRRTAELELKNRELEIESALERIRAKATAMKQSSDLLDIVVTMRHEFTKLGHRADYFWHMMWLPDKYEKAMTSGDGARIGNIMELPRDFHHRYDGVSEWESGEEPFMILALETEEAVDYIDKMITLGKFHQVDPNAPTLDDIRHIQGITFVMARTSHGEIGYSLPGVVKNPPKEDLDILVRFAGSFDLAHRRFLDLQRSEKQAREVQIELGLEKVRSRAMAMSHSDELLDVASVMFQEIKDLGVPQWNCGFNIWKKGDKEFTYYPGSPDGKIIPFSCKIPLHEHPIFRKFDQSKKKGEKLLVYEKKGEEQKDHYAYMLSLPGVGDFLRDMMDADFELPEYQVDHLVNFAYGNLLFITYEQVPEMHDVFIRFAKVFEQVYTRFLDLQKAEEQAREAQIEAALERVRARSMAMQDTEELHDVLSILFQQFDKLEIKPVTAFLSLFDLENNQFTYRSTTKAGNRSQSEQIVDLASVSLWDDMVNKWKSEKVDDIEEFHYTKEMIPQLLELFDETFSAHPEEERVSIQDFPNGAYSINAYCKFGYLGLNLQRPATDEERDILARFAREFTRVYQRFLDLQKAEAQARESQIEGALERVRSRTMGMINSIELSDVASMLFKQITELNIAVWTAGFNIWSEDDTEYEDWITSPKGGFIKPYKVDTTHFPVFMEVREAKQRGDDFFVQYVEGENLKKMYSELVKFAPPQFEVMLQDGFEFPKQQFNHFVFGNSVSLMFITYEPLPEAHDIFIRFGKVFQQTYTRFLDLKKAEAQAREAQIEAALERVRSKTMAMHNSKDMEDIVITLFEEVLALGLDSSMRCGLGILEGHQGMETRSVNADSEGKVELRVGMLNMKIHPMLVGLKKAWEKGEKGYSYYYTKEDVLTYYKALNDEPEYPFNANLEELPQQEYHRSYFFSSGILFAFSEEPISEESSGILARFASVFGQTYRRYLDLQKAEAQAKEAQIEAALEKVRSRTMAMQSSEELQEAANLLFLEVQDLGINAWSAGYNILSEDKKSSVCWMSSEGELQDPFPLYYTEEASFKEMGKFLKGKKKFFVQELKGKALVRHYDYMKSLPELKETFKHLDEAGLSLPTYQVNHLCKFSQGYLLFITYEEAPEAHDVFQRFTKVFEQTYTRFLDLKKAENQSKEAQIELALERVRASTMAMHKSEQLAETAEVLFEQFDLLGKIPDRISIAILNEKKKLFELWATDQEGNLVDHRHDFSIDEPTCMARTYKAWKDGKETDIVDLQGKELQDWVKYVKEETEMEIDASHFGGRRVQNTAFFSHGYLMLSSLVPISDEIMQLLVRFAKVFEQSYRRFLDLQNAEKQAREAIKRASVDRVRAEIASMRTSKDLNRITPLVWTELTTLNVPFIRCGVFIMDEEKEEVQTHLSTPDGKALASFQLPFEDTKPLDKLLPFWKKNEMYTDYWDRKAFIESTRILMEKGAISSKETYLTKNQPSNLYLHFLPFLQGMLYVGSEVPLNDDELSLVQNLADAFSSAYARYEDFNKLELANKKIEKTLVDLRQAQSQLVQSEKMASLGELTAGIAHEIQNPLNFVNNFAEVSAELVDEMNEEIESGDMEEVKYISEDLKLNLEKINHHGKRAGAIVKGMLQHSRTSSGTRELTDINVLADEYLRLAFHGLRAKDKSFNADFKLEIDESLPKVEIVPQDFGRVLLNLINNAFYAVDEKKKQTNSDFEPKVILSTKRTKEGMEITVSDNGNGIPKKVLDKIFQPFFTTKPTGKGTGLGLSLSYDIVRAHGGELQVTTKEGEGTIFSINLFF